MSVEQKGLYILGVWKSRFEDFDGFKVLRLRLGVQGLRL